MTGVQASISQTTFRVLRVHPPDVPEAVLRASALALTALTVVIWISGDIQGHGVLPVADVALDTVALAVSATLALMAWIRLRERDEPIALYHASAFLAFAFAYGAALLISIDAARVRSTLAEPDASQGYVYAVARLVAALLLVAGGLARWPAVTRRSSVAILLVPSLDGPRRRRGRPSTGRGLVPSLTVSEAGPSVLPSITPFGAVVQLVTAALFFGASYLCRAAWHRQHAVFDAWLAVGLLFAGFAELLWALYPSGHPGHVSIADLLRLAFFVALLIGVEAEASVTMKRMRAANVELEALREAEGERAALEERARLARELHDGLAQDLWLAKLRAGELASMGDLSPEARRAVKETESAIDNGLAEARGAVFALRVSATPGQGFRSVLRQTAEDFEDRYGIGVVFRASGPTTPIATRTEAEILRVAQEALTNIRRHADATVVQMDLRVTDGWMELHVADNGRGFDVGRGGEDWYGLASMHERAALVGGSLDVRSAPGSGTTVLLRVPVTPARPSHAGSMR